MHLLTVKRHFFDSHENDVTPEIPVSDHMSHIDNVDLLKDALSERGSDTAIQDLPCIDFADQHLISDLQTLQSEGHISHGVNCDAVNFKIKNPQFYPVASRASILDDFQHLVQQDLKTLYDRNIKIKNI